MQTFWVTLKLALEDLVYIKRLQLPLMILIILIIILIKFGLYKRWVE